MLIVINVCIGLVYGNVMAIAMYPLGQHAGMGASVIGVVSAVLASGVGVFISQQLVADIFPIVFGFLATSILALILVFRFGKQVELV